MIRLAVVGAGSWGTALANVAAKNGNHTYLWARRQELADEINKSLKNEQYLPGASLSSKISVSTDIEQVVSQADIIIMAIPSQAVRDIAKKSSKFIKKGAIIVSASKGIELKSFKSMSQVLSEELCQKNKHSIVALSGPSHAEEVVRDLPTAVVAASADQQAAKMTQDILMNNNFRIYTSMDIIGVELGGALKNVIALCSGISDGLEYGDNTRAALMTRGIAEITRLGIKLGACPATFSGLSGIGDLIVTCSSRFSRNRKAGIRIGKGEPLEKVVKSTNMIIEGVNTTKAVFELAKKQNIEMPISEQAYLVLFKGKDPATAVKSLMSRAGKHEHKDIISHRFFTN